MSHSIFFGILLSISLITSVMHFHQNISILGITIFGLLFAWNILWNEVLPRIFPNSFGTIIIKHIDDEKPSRHGVEQ